MGAVAVFFSRERERPRKSNVVLFEADVIDINALPRPSFYDRLERQKADAASKGYGCSACGGGSDSPDQCPCGAGPSALTLIR